MEMQGDVLDSQTHFAKATTEHENPYTSLSQCSNPVQSYQKNAVNVYLVTFTYKCYNKDILFCACP